MTDRLDRVLVTRGLTATRSGATALIGQGKVRVDGHVATKAGQRVAPDSAISVDGELNAGFASRAALKLNGVLDALASASIPVPIQGQRCLDVGASTGGFTDVLLDRGARGVVALDVGHGQLVDRLRRDPRVAVIEGFNARNLTVSDLPWQPQFVVADVSFISLTMLVGPIARCMTPGGMALLMVKPQFEVGRERLGTDGVVRSAQLWAQSVAAVVDASEAAGLEVRAIVPSGLPGPHGNREFFVLVQRIPTGRVNEGNLAGQWALDAMAQVAQWDPAAGRPIPVAERVGMDRAVQEGQS